METELGSPRKETPPDFQGRLRAGAAGVVEVGLSLSFRLRLRRPRSSSCPRDYAVGLRSYPARFKERCTHEHQNMGSVKQGTAMSLVHYIKLLALLGVGGASDPTAYSSILRPKIECDRQRGLCPPFNTAGTGREKSFNNKVHLPIL